ncbi:MAG: hypothetical protein ACN6OR_01015 [Stenotrophomonas sp.]|uniref:hypothetical protein n=2 Tax=Stenotrophomonas sp. TaxID=69392 RepID=UPI0028AACBCE|nr:hypothetical protein [Stenotrophomonas sp.]
MQRRQPMVLIGVWFNPTGRCACLASDLNLGGGEQASPQASGMGADALQVVDRHSCIRDPAAVPLFSTELGVTGIGKIASDTARNRRQQIVGGEQILFAAVLVEPHRQWNRVLVDPLQRTQRRRSFG